MIRCVNENCWQPIHWVESTGAYHHENGSRYCRNAPVATPPQVRCIKCGKPNTHRVCNTCFGKSTDYEIIGAVSS